MKKLSFLLIFFLSNLSIICNKEKKVKNNTDNVSINNNDNELFKSLRNLISLIDELRDCGVNEYIELPRICTLGAQSSGKSSVLESIVGLDFLPRGNGVVTRRPLELRLYRSDTNWAKFQERDNIIYTDFTQVKQTIEELTKEICGNAKNITDKPIILSVHCITCPDLTLIDLPGITKVPVGEQPENVEEITRNIATKYINNNLTVILCVMSANNDIATSDGLQLAKEIDKNGTRTLGVLTKLDIMDEGTDASKMILNKEIELKLGYIGIINRSKKDLDNKLSMEEISKKEKEFFKSHHIYKKMNHNFFGTEALINKLTEIYFEKITQNLPKIIKSIDNNINKIQEELQDLGEPMPKDKIGKINILLNMINEYCEIFKNILQGKSSKKNFSFLKNEGGYKIRKLFENLLKNYINDYNAADMYNDDEIIFTINKHEGHSIPGFPSVDAFFELLEPLFEKLKNPIQECFRNVFQYLTFISRKILVKIFNKFPNELNNMNEIINNYLNQKGNKTQFLIESVFNMETKYLFTNDQNYLENFSGTFKYDKLWEMRKRINAFFKVIVRNLRESIPKIIGNFLVKEIEDNMQIELNNIIYNLNNTDDILIENEKIIERRKELKNMIEIMKKAKKIIRNNPFFIDAMKI